MGRKQQPKEPSRIWEWGERFWWGLVLALWIAGWALPVEGPTGMMAGVPLAVGWGVCGLLGAILLIRRAPLSWRISWCDYCVGGLVVWGIVATLWGVYSEQIYARAGLNLSIQLFGLSCVYGVAKLAFEKLDSSRWILAMLVGSTGFLATAGIYEYAVEMPRVRRAYFDVSENQKQRLLAGAGVSDTDPDSRERKLYEDRFRATEPMATFAHTNSLAIVIAVGFSILLLWSLSSWKSMRSETRWAISLLVIMGIVMAGCLILTKSRTSWLSLILVVPSYFVLRRMQAKVVGWTLAAGALLIVVGIAALQFGVLDVEVFSEAPKSLLYRLEYWQATAGMIADHPLTGVGLGSFQDRYAQYQLPQASETVADPHNAPLEIAATLGLPGLGFLLLIVAVAIGTLRHNKESTLTDNDDTSSDAAIDTSTDKAPMLGGLDAVAVGIGLCLGLLLGFMLSIYSGLFPSLEKWAVALPMGLGIGVVTYLWLPLSKTTCRAAIGVGMLVWGISLLFAGGMTAWNVAQLGWLLLGAWIALSGQGIEKMVPRSALLAKAAVLGVALLAAWVYGLKPVMTEWTSQVELSRSMSFGSTKGARRILDSWQRVDPWSDAVHQRRVQVAFANWQKDGSPENRKQLLTAISDGEAVRPRVAAKYRTFAMGFLAGYGQRGDREDLRQAIRFQQNVVDWAPSDALAHVQLAYMLDMDGKDSEASQAAATALRLDEINPHADRDLSGQFVMNGLERDRRETAEQIALRLRSDIIE